MARSRVKVVDPTAEGTTVRQRNFPKFRSMYEGKPDTPCAECGGPVKPGTGYVTASTGPQWSTHRQCFGMRPEAVVKALTGQKVSHGDARLLADAGALPSPFAARTTDVFPGRPQLPGAPWAFVTKRERQKLLSAIMRDLPRLRAEAAGPFTLAGAGETFLAGCAFCGARTAKKWFTEGHRGADGADAALCDRCQPAFLRSAGVSGPGWKIAAQRVAITAAATGVRVSEVDARTINLPAWAERARLGDAPNTRPWAHLPAGQLDQLREHLWAGAYTWQAPADVQARIRDEQKTAWAERVEKHRREHGQGVWEWSS